MAAIDQATVRAIDQATDRAIGPAAMEATAADQGIVLTADRSSGEGGILGLGSLFDKSEQQQTANPMSNFPPTTDELFETFEDLEEWDERYDFIIDLGRELPTLPAELQTEENIVKGCMSTVWVVTDVEGEGDAEKLNIQADSDSIIVKGLIVLLLAFYNNMSPQEVASADVESYLGKLGLNQHLSPQRRNGLFSMVKRLRTVS